MRNGDFVHHVRHLRRVDESEAEEPTREAESKLAQPIREARRRAFRTLREAVDHAPSPRVRESARALLDRWTAA
jgi:vacuolar-type H+-ATPase subunit H